MSARGASVEPRGGSVRPKQLASAARSIRSLGVLTFVCRTLQMNTNTCRHAAASTNTKALLLWGDVLLFCAIRSIGTWQTEVVGSQAAIHPLRRARTDFVTRIRRDKGRREGGQRMFLSQVVI